MLRGGVSSFESKGYQAQSVGKFVVIWAMDCLVSDMSMHMMEKARTTQNHCMISILVIDLYLAVKYI